MHPILVLLRKDFLHFFRNKGVVALTFVVPFALIYLFGQVFGLNRRDSGPVGIPLAVVNLSPNPAAQNLIAALQAEKAFKVRTQFTPAGASDARALTEADLRPLMRANEFRFALVIPADLVSESAVGLHLKIYSNPRNEIETQTVNGLLQKTIFSQVPQLLGQSLQAQAKHAIGERKLDTFNRTITAGVVSAFGGNPDNVLKSIEDGNLGFDRLPAASSTTSGAAGNSGQETSNGLASLMRLETVQVVGENVKAPAATRVVGGWAMQFLLFALSASAAALFYERDHGLFHRILAGPVSRAHILWSKFIYGVSLGLIQLLVLFIAGRLLYGIDIEHHFGFLTLVCAFAAAACTSFGMLLASVTSNREAASGLATFLILLMCSIGGAWFPVTLMPEFIQQLSKLSLVYWAMEGFNQVLWANASFIELLPTLGVLGGITAVVMAVAVWRFNRGKLFD